MATKTFKLGEVARGGVITVETNKTKVSIIVKDWDFSTGSRRSSNQSNAQELYRKEVYINDRNAYNELMRFMYEETTSYWAEKIMDWIQLKVKFNTEW
jgi:hypothetical protein